MRTTRYAVASVCTRIISIALILAAPAVARAQLSVGGYVGAEFDNQNNWILYGAEARLGLESMTGQPYDANLRYTYHSYGSGASVSQLDLNALYNWKLASPGLLAPYVGLGAAYVRFSGGGMTENKVGLNIISGTKVILDPTSRIDPFLNMQYTIIRDFPNSYTLTVGLSVLLGDTPGKH
ncbi:MAG: hypothetical protein ABI338_04990 [Gemmatimonadaceae bacterium]